MRFFRFQFFVLILIDRLIISELLSESERKSPLLTVSYKNVCFVEKKIQEIASMTARKYFCINTNKTCQS